MAKSRRVRRRRSTRSTRAPRGICRIDQPSTRTHGFFVRLGWYRRRDGSYGPRHRAFFGDVTHGGKRGALKAAQAWVAKLTRTTRKAKPKRRAKARRRSR